MGRLTHVIFMLCIKETFSLVMLPPYVPHPMLDVMGMPLLKARPYSAAAVGLSGGMPIR
jgi:hypothetical protein